jgi:hypothetical protein
LSLPLAASNTWRVTCRRCSSSSSSSSGRTPCACC